MTTAIIEHSLRDVIHILEHNPVYSDLVVQIPIAQIMNRAPIAHLSIERAFKYLIQNAGGQWKCHHHLHSHFEQVRVHSPDSAVFLDDAFNAAVTHYRYNPGNPEFGHLKTLGAYLSLVGTADAFNKMRYWELGQALDEPLLRRVRLEIHTEILHSLNELLLRHNGIPSSQSTLKCEG